MAATTTLSTTTLQSNLGATDAQIKVGSTSGLTAGTRLWVDRELMSVVSLGIDPWVNVLRGVDGTAAAPHNSSSTITIGRADQFYAVDPTGRPNDAILVSPYINILNGNVWYARGDNLPPGEGERFWQLQTTTYGTGGLGQVTTTLDPTVST